MLLAMAPDRPFQKQQVVGLKEQPKRATNNEKKDYCLFDKHWFRFLCGVYVSALYKRKKYLYYSMQYSL